MGTWQITPVALLYFGATVLSPLVAYLAWQLRPARGATLFSIMLLGTGAWALGYSLSFFNTDLDWKLLMLRVEYLGMTTTALFWLLFAIYYTHSEQWLPRSAIALLSAIPVATLLQVLFIEQHGFFYSDYGLATLDGFVLFTKEYGPGFYLWIGYGYFIMVGGVAILVRDILELPGRLRLQSLPLLLILVGMLIPNILYVTGHNPIHPYDPNPLAFLVIGLIFAVTMWRYRFLDVVPAAYRLAFRSVTNGVIIIDERMRMLEVNPIAAKLLGRPREELMGEAIGHALPEHKDRLSSSEDEVEFDAVLASEEGERHCEIQTAPLLNRRGGSTGRIIVMRDVTERVRNEEALRQREREYQTVFELAADPLVLVAEGGRILDVNTAACQAYGYDRASFVGMSIRDIVHPSKHDDLLACAKALQENRPMESESVCVRADGTTFDVEVRVSPIIYQGERVALAAARDVTRRKQMEAALRRGEQRFREVLENARHILYRFDYRKGCYDYVSPFVEEYSGWTVEEVLQKNMVDAERETHPDDWRHMQEVIAREMARRPQRRRLSLTFDYRRQKKNGEYRWLSDWCTFLLDESGQVESIVGSAYDITERKQFEQALEQRRNELSKRLRELNCLYDISRLAEEPEISIDRFVKSVVALMPGGWEYPDITRVRITLHDQEFTSEDYHPSTWRQASDILVGGEAIGQVEVVYIEPRPERDEGPFLSEERHLLNAIAERLGNIVAHNQSQRERAMLQEQLNQAQRMEAIGTLSAGVAHDFSNVLTVIVGHTNLAARLLNGDHPARKELLMVQKATQQAVGLTRALFTFGQELSDEKEPIDLATLVEDSARLLRRVLPAAIKLIVDSEAEGPLWVDGDRTQLQQLVLNLVINARDAMPDGGTLTLRTDAVEEARTRELGASTAALLRGPLVRLTVSDTGLGIAPEAMSRVFQPFYTTKDRDKSTGLGLSIVHGVVKDHGGRVDVESEPGEGSTFKVYLPASQADVSILCDDAAPKLRRGEGQRILLAEDDPHVRGIVSLALESLGYQVIQAEDGPGILSTYDQQGDHVDLMVLDVDLPGQSGPESLRQLRHRGVDTPAILITGAEPHIAADLDTRSRLLLKPFDVSELASAAAEALGEVQGEEKR